jgi:hypothetical protein
MPRPSEGLVQAVGVPGAGGHHRRPHVLVPQLLQRPVVGVADHRDRPGAAVAREREQGERPDGRLQARPDLRQLAVPGPEEPGVVAEPRVRRLLVRRPVARRVQPRRQRGPAPGRFHDEVGVHPPAGGGVHGGHQRGAVHPPGHQAVRLHAPLHLQPRFLGGRPGDHLLQRRPAGGHRDEPVVVRAPLPHAGGRWRVTQRVVAQRPGHEQCVPDVRQLRVEHPGRPGVQEVRLVELRHPGPAPALPRIGGGVRDRCGVPLEHPHLVPVPGQHQSGREPAHTAAEHHDRSHAVLRPWRRRRGQLVDPPGGRGPKKPMIRRSTPSPSSSPKSVPTAATEPSAARICQAKRR